MAAPADLGPPKGLGLGLVLRLGLGLGLGLWSDWSGPTCKTEIDYTRPAQFFVPSSPAHNQSHAYHMNTRCIRTILVYVLRAGMYQQGT